MTLLVQNRPFCLASSSPRRQAFMKNYGFRFECYSPDIDEKQSKDEDVEKYVIRLANQKAEQVLNIIDFSAGTIILAGDTSVYLDDEVLGKPEDEQHAKAMLRQLSGRSHQVYSGFTLLDTSSNEIVSEMVVTEVQFRQLSDDLIKWYVETGEPSDKAGAYSIQGLGTILVDSIKGSFNNVVGFPIECILAIMQEKGWISFKQNNQNQN